MSSDGDDDSNADDLFDDAEESGAEDPHAAEPPVASDDESGSESLPLSSGEDESENLELPGSDVSGDMDNENVVADETGDLEQDRLMPGSCDELEAKMDAILGPDTFASAADGGLRRTERESSAFSIDGEDGLEIAASTAAHHNKAETTESAVESSQQDLSNDVGARTSPISQTEPDTSDGYQCEPQELTAVDNDEAQVHTGEEIVPMQTDDAIDTAEDLTAVPVDVQLSPGSSTNKPLTELPSPLDESGTKPPEKSKPEPATRQRSSPPHVGYSVVSVFPVVYEKRTSATDSTSVDLDTNPASPSPTTKSPAATPQSEKRTRHAASLQRRLESLQSELHNSKRAFKLQLSLLEADKKTLSQRNARLHSQLASVTSNLQRVSSELARLKTENEMYASKLPQLQAELLHESTQVDDGRAQSLQAQLSIGQLKARAQVLQTRSEALENANAKLTAKLRECNQELRRKVELAGQSAAKTSQIEIAMRDLKSRHNDEVVGWKNRAANAAQRFQAELAKEKSKCKQKIDHQAAETKRIVEKTGQKRRELELRVARLEETVEQYKRETESNQDTLHRARQEAGGLHSLLTKAHKTEAALRQEIAAVRGQLRCVEQERRRFSRETRPVAAKRYSPRARHHRSYRLDIDEDGDNNQEGAVSSLFTHANHENNVVTATVATNTIGFEPEECVECLKLHDQLRAERDELCRVRARHADELRAQSLALDSLLQRQP